MKIDKLKKFFSKNDIKQIIPLLLLMVASSSMELISVLSVGPLVELLLSDRQYIEIGQTYQISRFGYLVSYLIILATSLILALFTVRSLSIYSARFGMKLSDNFFAAYLKNSRAAQELSKAYILKQVMTETQRFTGQIVIPFLQAASKLLTVSLLLILLLTLNFAATVVLLSLIIIFYGLLLRMIAPRITANGFLESTAIEQRIRVFNSFLGARTYSFLYVDRDKITSTLFPHSNKFSSAQSSNLFLTQVPRYAIETSIFVGSALFLYVMKPTVAEASVISIYIFSFLKLLPGLQQIYYAYITFRANKASFVLLNDSALEAEDYGTDTVKFTSKLEFKALKYAGLSENNCDGITLTVNKGDKIIIKGPSGCGKSSLLKVILGLVKEHEGCIKFDDQISTIDKRLNYAKERITYVEQFPAFYDASLNEVMGLSTNKDIEKLRFLMKKLELHDRFEYYLQNLNTELAFEELNLSGGEVQKLAFCRALLTKSDILLLDEPFSALDAKSADTIDCLIRESTRTFIIISHTEITGENVYRFYQFQI